MNKKLMAGIVALMLIFSIVIYPTLFFYTKWNAVGNEYLIKINRVTGKVQVLDVINGWEDLRKK